VVNIHVYTDSFSIYYILRWLTMLRTSRKTSNSSMMNEQTGNTSRLRWVGGWYETGTEEVVVIWPDSSFSHSTITDYQMIVSKDLPVIIKSFDTGFQFSVWLSKVLIIQPKSSTIKSINTQQKDWQWVLTGGDCSYNYKTWRNTGFQRVSRTGRPKRRHPL
jgi:hypothetical protein